MSELRHRIGALSSERRELLLRLLARAQPGHQDRRIRRRRRTGPAPLVFAQQRLWVAHQLGAGGAAYNSPLALRLSGPLDLAALAYALTTVRRRHETLRSRFPLLAGEPVQLVQPPAPLPVPVVDLTAVPPARRPATARHLAETASFQGFDLAAGPVMRCAVLRLAAEDTVLLLTFHHIVFDGWSAQVLLREVAAFYQARRRGERAALPELAIQYADFAVWQRERLAGAALERLLAHWRERLAGAPAETTLPPDRPRPAAQTDRGACQVQELVPTTVAALTELGRSEGASFFMVCLAAFTALLQRLTGRDDLVVGTVSAARHRPETEELIGFLVNLLPLRLDAGGNPSFRHLLRRVRKVALEAFAHDELPFDKLVEELRPRRNPQHHPLVQVIFNSQNAPAATALGDLRAEALEVGRRASKLDLVVALTETADGARVSWTYNRDLFAAASMEGFLAGYLEVLEAAVADPEVRLADLTPAPAQRSRRMSMETQDRRDLRRRRLGGPRREIDLSQVELVGRRELEGTRMPLVFEPTAQQVDLAEWARAHHRGIEDDLEDRGALLFRGFEVPDVAAFERFAAAACPRLYGGYGDLPREEGGEKIYRSTPYPPTEAILFHNESSHLDRWPLRQLFCCLEPSAQGGETPIVDCRRVYRELPADIVERFSELGLLYVRNFTPGLDVDWRDFFHTTERQAVEAVCRESGTECEWKPDGGLRTRRRAPGTARHPRTGEPVFFNQIQLHHVSRLEPATRRSLLASFSEDNLPRNVYFGDGSPIPDEVVDLVTRTYWDCSVAFPWQQGDVLMVDNMLVAHARNPYSGSRRIAVAMGELVSWRDLAA